MTASAQYEIDLLDTALDRYRAEGFTVFINPSRAVLPQFFGSYRPDAIAIKDDKKIIIEFKRSPRPKTEQDKITELLADHPEWDYIVYYATPESGEGSLAVAQSRDIARAIEDVVQLKKGGLLQSAMVMAWSTLEAVARALLPESLSRPQTPQRIVETLAGEGLLTPDEADHLRNLIQFRNAAAHGVLNVKFGAEKIDEMISVLNVLTEQLKNRPK